MKQIFHDYFEYESLLAKGILLPFLEYRGISLQGKRVLDVGCGEGGILHSLAERFELEGMGIDYDENMIYGCRPVKGVEYKSIDFFEYDFQGKLILFCFETFLSIVLMFLLCFHVFLLCYRIKAWFTQHTRLIFLPSVVINITEIVSLQTYHTYSSCLKRFFLKLIDPSGNIYKTSTYLVEDLKRIRKTWLTTRTVIELCKKCSLKILFKRMFIIRPDYRYKFGLPTVAIPSFVPLTTVLDVFSTRV